MVGVAEMDKFCEEPAARVRVAGLAESEKLGGGAAAVTVSTRDAELVSVPAVPVNSTVAVAVGAGAAAERVTCCGVPGVSAKVDGDAVTPEGNPLTVTWTD